LPALAGAGNFFGSCLVRLENALEIPDPKNDNNAMIKQALIGPDGKLRFFWRAVIFYSLGNWRLYPGTASLSGPYSALEIDRVDIRSVRTDSLAELNHAHGA
jgi:hypothetical protein